MAKTIYAAMQEHWLSIGQSKIYCCIHQHHPEAPWLIFLHEALGSVAQWYGFPQKVADGLHANILLYDRLGHGQSDPEPQPRPIDFHWQEIAQRLPLLLKAFAIHNFYLIGHSDGGVMALLAAATSTIQPRGAVCISAMTDRSPTLSHAINGVISDPSFTETKNKLQKYHYGKETQLVESWLHTWHKESLPKLGMLEQLDKINVPTLLLQGSEDQFGGVEHLQKLTDNIPHAQHTSYRRLHSTVVSKGIFGFCHSKLLVFIIYA